MQPLIKILIIICKKVLTRAFILVIIIKRFKKRTNFKAHISVRSTSSVGRAFDF